MLLAVPMAWIRHLKYFSFTNFLANVIVLVALGTLLTGAISGLAQHGPSPNLQKFGPQWLLFAGTSVFSFECINFVIPMYEAHQNKKTFIPILTGTLWVVVVLFIAFGSLNYMHYGVHTKAPVTANFAENMQGSPLSKSMQFAFAFASLLNIPLFLFPASIAIEDKVFDGCDQGLFRKWLKNLLRTALVFICTVVAWLGSQHINALVAIIGSVCCVPLAFIFPVICHKHLFRPGPAGLFCDACIGTLGVFLFVMTTFSSVQEFK